ncbi:ATP-dependent DNA helicase RecG [Thiorhodospira sibirica]|uniref:ATP-dependent DNA helicase RecG n=1 Tax=Thiorhodospira sibirica TaxID=154347 RepID=UPI00022C52B5|nr:ATP-dependent DNA helicase RecG [Thiorhodospira sibirica]
MSSADPRDAHLNALPPEVPSTQRAQLARLGIYSLLEVLFHLPVRYQDRTRLTPIRDLRLGDQAIVEGEVQHSEVLLRRRRMWVVRVFDGTGYLVLRFFNFSQAQQQGLCQGTRVRCFGEIRRGFRHPEIIHPEYRVLGSASLEVDDYLRPIYPATEGLTQRHLHKLTDLALSQCTTLVDWLPPQVLAAHGFPALAEALATVHRPAPEIPRQVLLEGRHPAQRRLAFEELLAHHLGFLQLRQFTQRQQAPSMRVPGALWAQLLQCLPFRPTAAQRRVMAEILADMARPQPMLRLVQGDVGCGKTLVAMAICLHAVEAGWQAAVMAPTELLAEQHYRYFHSQLAPLGIEVAWLAGKLTAKARQRNLAAIAQGRAAMVIGTHALFQSDVHFARLGLIVIDEQHRFGVHQRLALREKGAYAGALPHQLIMTATPIPRTLSMTAYADLDHSIIDELPPGRSPVKTVAISESRRDLVIERIREACAGGMQAYWVCTLIEESEHLQYQAAEQTFALLASQLVNLRLGLVHGRMKGAEKEAVMAAFKQGALDVLVATTVIEVGVDVPNASLMIIENAERLGLAQLHQLRGRVGRGRRESACVLLYRSPLNDLARERLDTLRRSNDGFEIAQVDLQLRGPGEVLGTRQTGVVQFRIADILRDQDLLDAVRQAAALIWHDYPGHVEPLIQRWLGSVEQYGQIG